MIKEGTEWKGELSMIKEGMPPTEWKGELSMMKEGMPPREWKGELSNTYT